MGGAGYDISASGSQSLSNASGSKVGPVYFGPATFGAQGSPGPSKTTWLMIAAAAAAAAFFFLKK